jgi:hypothetical protein
MMRQLKCKKAIQVSLEDINSKMEKMKCEKAIQVSLEDINSEMKIKILQAENEVGIRVVSV